MGASGVAVVIGDEEFVVSADTPFVFGRHDADGVVGLDPADMGISAEAGSIEHAWGVWWVVNRSRKRKLLVEERVGTTPLPLECQQRHAITREQVTVIVPGAIYTHRLEVVVPTDAIKGLRVTGPTTTGTLTAEDVRLLDRDREALTAIASGYLRAFPYRDPRPLTYQQAADLLGAPWTRVTVRKQIERLRERLARTGLYFDGARALDDLAEYAIGAGIIGPADLDALTSDS
jgi:hypothetical protein